MSLTRCFPLWFKLKKIWRNTLPNPYRFPLDKALAAPNGMGKVFVKVNYYSVKFDYCDFCHASTLELSFHMVENLKMYMKDIKFPMCVDLIYLGSDILSVLRPHRLVLSEILTCRFL